MTDAQAEMPVDKSVSTGIVEPQEITPERNVPTQERIGAVGLVIEGLLGGHDVEVSSAQPESLRQFERTDADGNTMTFIQDEHGRLTRPVEVRDANGRLIAQSWDTQEWSVDRYIQVNTDYTVQPQEDPHQ